MEIFLQLLDELDDLVLSVAAYWETIRRLLLRAVSVAAAGGIVTTTAGFFPNTVLTVCTAVLLSTALVAVDRHHETFERSSPTG